MNILGIDPGTRVLGWGIVRREGNRFCHVDNGSLYFPPIALAEKLKNIFDEISILIEKYDVQEMVVENVFYCQSARALQRLGEVRGVVMLSAACAQLPIAEYAAREVKKAITGYGAADKIQMTKMVRTLLGLRDLAEENASDALALALCHAQSASNIHRVSLDRKSRLSPAQEILRRAHFYR